MFPRNLKLGSRGPAVWILKVILLTDLFEGKRIDLNGVFDEDTAQLVIKLQATLNVNRTGEFNEETRAAIKEQWGLDLSLLDTDDFTSQTRPTEDGEGCLGFPFFDLSESQTPEVRSGQSATP